MRPYIYLVMVFLAIALLAGCSKQNDQATDAVSDARTDSPVAEVDDKPRIRATLDHVSLRWQDGDELRLSAKAGKVVGDEMTGTGALEDVTALLYRDGRNTTILKAPHINADRTSATLIATGGAELESVDRRTVLRCPRIEWYADKHKIVGSGGVKVDSEAGLVEAESFVADTELRTIEFYAGASRGRAVIGSGQQ